MGISDMSGAVARRRSMLLGLFAGLVVFSFMVPMAIVLVMFRTFFIPSGAMENTLLVGDNIVVRQVLFRPVERGDVVVFKLPSGVGSYHIKRCVAVAGDRLAIKNGSLYLNDKPLDEPYARGRTLPVSGSGAVTEGVIPKGKIAVLGDNRENSLEQELRPG